MFFLRATGWDVPKTWLAYAAHLSSMRAMSANISSDSGTPDWEKIAADPDFAALKKAKLSFIVPASIFFFIYYMTLPVMVGFFPDLMKTQIIGKINIAYVFALSQFLMTWVICGLYVRVAKRWDIMNAELLAKYSHS
ncbi:MAG: hypothetical protein RL693_1807 [Verrucomicrobiota bacterium]|jgi:uncharacterized membrane protein (DUF485 family)